MGFIQELWGFLKVRKKLWLLPILIVMGLLATLVIVGSQSSAAPFIYTLF